MSRTPSPEGADPQAMNIGSAIDSEPVSNTADSAGEDWQQRFYAAAVGRGSRRYYLKSFSRFDRHPLRLSWNGTAFLFSFLWLLYRRLWGVATFHLLLPVVLFLIVDLVALGDRDLQIGILGGYLAYSFVLLPLVANGFYYRKVRSRIATLEKKGLGNEQIEQELARHGGGCLLAVLLCLLIVVSLIAAGAYRFGLPFYHDYVVTTKLEIGYEIASDYKADIEDYVKQHQAQLPTRMADLGEDKDLFYAHISAVTITDRGAVKVVFNAPDELAGRNLQLIPQVTPPEQGEEASKTKIDWRCEVTGVAGKFLPRGCHSN